MTINRKYHAAQKLRQIVAGAKGDDLERAQKAFGGMCDEALEVEHGQSGQTRRQIWEGYQQERGLWNDANALLNEMLAKESL